MARKIDWTPPAKVTEYLLCSVHISCRKRAVYFSTELNARTGLPKYRARFVRIFHNDYRFVIGRPSCDEVAFLKAAKKIGMPSFAGLVAATDRRTFPASNKGIRNDVMIRRFSSRYI
jgi:hypothetical protein